MYSFNWPCVSSENINKILSNTSWSMTWDIFLYSKYPLSFQVADLRFSCRLPQTLPNKNFNWRLWALVFNTIPQTSHGELSKASVVHRTGAGNHPRLWWFCWFVSDTALRPSTYILLVKLRACTSESFPRSQMKPFEHFTALMGKKKNCPLQLLLPQAPLGTPSPWMWMNWTTWRGTKYARPRPVPSDNCRFVADYKFNKIYRSQC